MNMGFSPMDWPQLPRESQDSGESSGPEWRALLARFDAAHHARLSLNDAGKLTQNGSFSPGSARSIETLGEDSGEDAGEGWNEEPGADPDGDVNEGESAGNHSVSVNGKPKLPDGSEFEEVGNELPDHTRD